LLLAIASGCGDSSRDADQPAAGASAATDEQPAPSETPQTISGTERQNGILRLAVTEAHFEPNAPDAPPGMRYYTIGLRGMSRSQNDVAIDTQSVVFAQNERGCLSRPEENASWLKRPFGPTATFTASGPTEGQLAFLVPDDTRQVRVLLAPAGGNGLAVPAGDDFLPSGPVSESTIVDGSALRVIILPRAERPDSLPLPAEGRQQVILDFVIENLQTSQGIEFTTSQQLRLVDPAGAFVQPSALTQQLGCRLDDGDPIPPGQVRRFQVVYELPEDAPLRLHYRGFEIDEAYVDLKNAPAAPEVKAQGIATGSRQDFDAEVALLRARLVRLQAFLDEFPAALTDVEALARQYATPEAAFEFLRDQVAFEPYAGVMKGARGTLLTRGGNALDRALLLAALLKHNGIEARIAHARLDDTQQRERLDGIMSAPPATGRMLATLSALENTAPANSSTTISDAVSRFGPLLEAALKSKGYAGAGDSAQLSLDNLSDHYWVQARINGLTMDLDPSRADAQFGQRLTNAINDLDPGQLPDDLFQHIRLRIFADLLAGNELGTVDVLSEEFRAVDLFGKNIRVAIAPRTTGANESSMQAILLVGDRRIEGQVFRLSGSPSATEATGEPALPAGGWFDSMSGEAGGEDDTQDAALTVLGRLTFEAVSRGPKLRELGYRRVIMDRLDVSEAGIASLDALADDQSVRPLLIQAWDGAISFGASHPVYVLQTLLDTMVGQQSMYEKALANLYLGESFAVDDLAPPSLSGELIGFYLSSDVSRHMLSGQANGPAYSYYERPRLAFFRHGFAVGDWARPNGLPRFEEGIDLLNSPFRFLGAGADSARLAIDSGVADTAIELSLVRDAVFNTLPLFAAADAQGVDTMSIGPGEAEQLRNLKIPPAIRRALTAELASGQYLLLPTRLVTLDGVQTFGWWSIDPVTGFALGKMGVGGGQGFVEVSKMNERIQQWTDVFTKFYGGVLRCYLGELQKNLGATPDALKTLQLKKGSGIGDNPVPDSTTLAQCVIKQICKTITELMINAAANPAFARQADEAVKGLEEVLYRWAQELLIDEAKSQAQGKAAAACEAGPGG
jgi:transglutaminase-like putative cysteine protease